MNLIPLDKGKRSPRTQNRATALDQLIEDYLTSCRARGLSPNTVDQSYAYPLKGILLPWAQRNQIEDVSGLDRRALDRLSGELLEVGGARGRQLSRYSVHAYMRAVNQFLSWSLAEGEEGGAKAQLPRRPKKPVGVPPREEPARPGDAGRTLPGSASPDPPWRMPQRLSPPARISPAKTGSTRLPSVKSTCPTMPAHILVLP